MSKSSPWRSPMIQIWCGLLFIFFVANGVFIYLALTSNPGLVVEDYYERGQSYEQNMLSRIAANPGWEMRIEMIDPAVQNQSANLRFYLQGTSGELLTLESVRLFVYRPSNANNDFDLPMRELSHGVYEVDVSFPLPGVWDLLAVVAKDGGEFSQALRVHVTKAP